MIEIPIPPEPELPKPQSPFHNHSHTHTFTSADFASHSHNLTGTAAWKMINGIPISDEVVKDASAFSKVLDAARKQMTESITTQLYAKSPLMSMVEKSLQEQEYSESLDSQGDNFGPPEDPIVTPCDLV